MGDHGRWLTVHPSHTCEGLHRKLGHRDIRDQHQHAEERDQLYVGTRGKHGVSRGCMEREPMAATAPDTAATLSPHMNGKS
jgi:hypothetical protein